MSEREAMAYLLSVEPETCHIDMAKDRAACGEYAYEPKAAADVLAWMEDELAIQREQDALHPEEERAPYVAVLERDIGKLHSLGIRANAEVFA